MTAKTVLFIDDEDLMLKCVDRALSSRGYKVIVTTDPDTFIKTARTDQVDLLLLDVKMPRKNGFDLYRELRQDLNIPVLFVTAYPRSFSQRSDEVVEMWKKHFADGTTDIIYKPFDLDTLFEKVEGLIGEATDTGAGE